MSALELLERLILVYFTALNSLYLVFTLVAFRDLFAYQRRLWRGQLEALLSESAYKPISILVPAYNERETIVANVRSLLNLGYPEFEIVVVNDGSKDDTTEVLKVAFELQPVPVTVRMVLETKPVKAMYRSLEHPNLIVIDKQNGGKSDALNAAINASSYPLFCCIDADSLLEHDALLRVARVFCEDDEAVAVGGIVRVLNGSLVEAGRVVQPRTTGRPIVLCQTLEYVRGFLAGRTALGHANALLIISGAFGLFRKDRVVAAGGYNRDTVCEDMEVVVRLHRRAHEAGVPARIVFVPDPVCWTQVPEDWRTLLRQRDRWQRGLIETLWMHRRLLLNGRYGAAGLIAFPFYTIFEALGPLVEVTGYVLLPIEWALGRLNPPFAVLFLVLAILYGILNTLLALILDDLLFRRYERVRDLARLVAAAFLEYAGFRQLLALQRFTASFSVRRRKATWGEQRRQAIAHGERTAGAPPRTAA